MGWLDTIRTLLGFDSNDRGEDSSTVAITVEKEPDPESERAVKEADAADADSRDSTGDEADAAETAPEERRSKEEETATDEEVSRDVESEPDDSGEVTLTDIQGIGPAYAERLENAGIEDVDALAAADPENLAERANISENRIQRWIDRATDR